MDQDSLVESACAEIAEYTPKTGSPASFSPAA